MKSFVGVLWSCLLFLLAGAITSSPELLSAQIESGDWPPSIQRGLEALGHDSPDSARVAAELFERGLAELTGEGIVELQVLNLLADAQFRGGMDELPVTLWRLFRKGQVHEGAQFALAAMEDSAFVSMRTELLVVLAASLGRQFYDPGLFLRSSSASILRGLFDDPAVGAGSRQLLSWHQPNIWNVYPPPDTLPGCSRDRFAELAGDSDRWTWWNTEAAPVQPLALSRSEAGRSLIRTLGNWYGQRQSPGDMERAQTSLCMVAAVSAAAVVTPLGISAFRDLVWSYLETGDREAIRALDQSATFRDQFHRQDRRGDDVRQGDKDYLKPIEDALNLHPWWRSRRNWLLTIGAVITACVTDFIICDGGSPTASGTITVTVP